MNTETNVTPEVPAWLNLDGYCPPEIRERLTNAAAALEYMLEDGEIERHFREAWETLRAFNDATACVDIDDDCERFGDFTGYNRFHAVMERIYGMVEAAIGESVSYRASAPSWYVPWGAELTEDVSS
jgi:hypothetical protein